MEWRWWSSRSLGRSAKGMCLCFPLSGCHTDRLQDVDLWVQDGDCNVYLFAKGRSRRGPSFQIPSQVLYDASCTPLISRLSPEGDSDSGYSSGSSVGGRLDLYIPVPDHLDRLESLLWHIATRNFFAWLLCKPIVGDCLGQSIVRLLERMTTFRDKSVSNLDDLLTYLDRVGYSHFTSHADHALAMLYFSERTRAENIWRNAFVHCVGMNEVLKESSEYEVGLQKCNIHASTADQI